MSKHIEAAHDRDAEDFAQGVLNELRNDDRNNVAPENRVQCDTCGRSFIKGRWDDYTSCLMCRNEAFAKMWRKAV